MLNGINLILIFKIFSLTYVLEILRKIGGPVQNSEFKVLNPLRIKFVTGLRLGFSHLNKHKFKHNFQNCVVELEVESTIHFFLHCYFFGKFLQILSKTVEKIIKGISHLNDDLLVNQLIYGSLSYSFEENNQIINASVKYI